MENKHNRSYVYKVALNSSMLNDARILASEYIPEGSFVLDVGCACGDFGDYLHKAKGVKPYGFEYDEKSIEIAKLNNVYKSILQIDLNSFDVNHYPDFHGFFDVIALIDVLEHTVEPQMVLTKLKVFLKEKGKFVISLPNASFGEVKAKVLCDNFEYTEMGVLDTTHLRFYTYCTMADLIAKSSLSIQSSTATVGSFTKFLPKLPFFVRRHIINNPRSHIFQYIFSAAPSVTPYSVLVEKNIIALDLGWSFITKPLRSIQGNPLVNFLLPIGSRRRLLMRKIINKISGATNAS